MDFVELTRAAGLVLFFWILIKRHLAARKANRILRESARKQAETLALLPHQVAPPPTGRAVQPMRSDGQRPNLAHAKVRCEQSAGVLTVLLPEVATRGHWLLTIFGYCFLAGAIAIPLSILLDGGDISAAPVWVVAAIVALIGRGLSTCEDLVFRVDFRDDEVTFTQITGIWFRTTTRVRRRSGLQFRGESESIFTMTREQFLPFYRLTIQSFGLARSYRVSCDSGVGDWLTATLQKWHSLGNVPQVLVSRSKPAADPFHDAAIGSPAS